MNTLLFARFPNRILKVSHAAQALLLMREQKPDQHLLEVVMEWPLSYAEAWGDSRSDCFIGLGWAVVPPLTQEEVRPVYQILDTAFIAAFPGHCMLNRKESSLYLQKVIRNVCEGAWKDDASLYDDKDHLARFFGEVSERLLRFLSHGKV